MSKRLAGVLLALLLSVVALAGPALAAEGGAEGGAELQPAPRTIDEVVADNDTAQEFVPEPYEEPSFFPILRLPLFLLGIIAALAVLFAYLVWQPRFAQERKEKSRRR